MKLLHTADLHIGKVINEFSMIEDQRYILKQITDIAEEQKVDVVILAGDIYDRAIPSVEAVELLDEFYTGLLEKKIQVMAITGNHDSPERVSFAENILEKQGLFISGVYKGELKKVKLQDEYGEVVFHFFPYVKTAVAGQYFEEKISSVQAMAEAVLKREEETLDVGKRNIMISHYFVLHGNKTAEEEEEVGGIEAMESSVFDAYDYVALGHIHGESHMGRKAVTYSGSPLKYSFAEAEDRKCVKLVTLKEKGNLTIENCYVTPLHDMRVIKGELKELMKDEVVEMAPYDDYICAVLTDKNDLINPMDTLRSVYPNAMQIIVERYQKQTLEEEIAVAAKREKGLLELYREFYELVEGETLEGEYLEVVKEIMEGLETGGKV